MCIRPQNAPSDTAATATSDDAGRPTGRFSRLFLAGILLLVGLALFGFLAGRLLLDRHETPPAPAAAGPPSSVPDVDLPTAAVEIANEELQAEGVAEAEKLLARFPDHPGAMHVAAMLYAGLRQTEKAEQIWRRSIAVDSQYAGPRVGLAGVLTERGRDEEAVAILASALADRCLSPEVYYQLAEVQTKLGRLDEAESTLRDGIAVYPRVSNLWFLLGQTQNQRQEFPQAEASLLKAVQLGCTMPTVYFALSNACVRQGKKEEAAEYRKRFSQIKAAGAKEAEGQPFHEKYSQALRPLVANTLAGCATVYLKENDLAEAERGFLRALALVPDNPDILRELASLLVRSGRIAQARTALQRLVGCEPANAADRMNLASVAAQLGDTTAAEASLRESIRLRPDWALPQVSLAQLYLQAGNFEQARTTAEKCIQQQPTPQAYAVLAAAAGALGDTATAKTAAEMAQRLSQAGPPPESGP